MRGEILKAVVFILDRVCTSMGSATEAQTLNRNFYMSHGNGDLSTAYLNDFHFFNCAGLVQITGSWLWAPWKTL